MSSSFDNFSNIKYDSKLSVFFPKGYNKVFFSNCGFNSFEGKALSEVFSNLNPLQAEAINRSFNGKVPYGFMKEVDKRQGIFNEKGINGLKKDGKIDLSSLEVNGVTLPSEAKYDLTGTILIGCTLTKTEGICSVAGAIFIKCKGHEKILNDDRTIHSETSREKWLNKISKERRTISNLSI